MLATSWRTRYGDPHTNHSGAKPRLDCCRTLRRLRKATTIRHNGKKLEDILDAHAKFHKGQPGGERADLSGADLSGKDFKKRDLTGALLVGCKLKGSDFRGAKLSFADLSKSDLRKA